MRTCSILAPVAHSPLWKSSKRRYLGTECSVLRRFGIEYISNSSRYLLSQHIWLMKLCRIEFSWVFFWSSKPVLIRIDRFQIRNVHIAWIKLIPIYSISHQILPNGRADLHSLRVDDVFNCQTGSVVVEDLCGRSANLLDSSLSESITIFSPKAKRTQSKIKGVLSCLPIFNKLWKFISELQSPALPVLSSTLPLNHAHRAQWGSINKLREGKNAKCASHNTMFGLILTWLTRDGGQYLD